MVGCDKGIILMLVGLASLLCGSRTLPSPPLATRDSLEVPEVKYPGVTQEVAARRRRKVTYLPSRRWTLPIPYLFDQSPQYKLSASETVRVKSAMRHLEQLTCITFREVNTNDSLGPILAFKKDGGCWSYVGREAGFQYQEVSTGKGCFELGTLLHELGHAIGFWHEHSRPDRGDFVRVHTEHVRRGEEFNFRLESWGEVDDLDVPYDVGSVMHYGSTYFSRSASLVTLETVDPRLQRALGQRQELSFFDVKRANKAYCSDICANGPLSGGCQHDGYPDPKDCSRCRCPPGLGGTTCLMPAPSSGAVCGGTVRVEKGRTHAIASPLYPDFYPPNIQCHWLLLASPGQQVKVTVSPRDFMLHPDCSPYNSSVCVDYLEIRYNLSFGYTGARYCCGLPPGEAIRSSGNSMLILFRSRFGGKGGFQAQVTAEACGGCEEGTGPQAPCRRRETWKCLRTWNSTQHLPLPCPAFLRPPSPDCGSLGSREKSRQATCTREVDYCCQDFKLTNGLCYIDAANGTTARARLPPTTAESAQREFNVTTSDIRGSLAEVKQDAVGGWSPWSEWSACSRPCGGCGLQARRRTCDLPTLCSSGKSQEEGSRACNTFPCSQMTWSVCSQSVVRQSRCGLLPCYRRETVPGPCFSWCCAGYTLVDGKCLPPLRNPQT